MKRGRPRLYRPGENIGNWHILALVRPRGYRVRANCCGRVFTKGSVAHLAAAVCRECFEQRLGMLNDRDRLLQHRLEEEFDMDEPRFEPTLAEFRRIARWGDLGLYTGSAVGHVE